MRYFPSFLTLAFCTILVGAKAQSTGEDSVKAAVNKLFTAMKDADTALLNSSFTDSAILQSIRTDKQGKIAVMTVPLRDFARVIGKMGKGDADERMRIDIIKIDGPLASVWGPYSFYYKGHLHHCGADSFQLLLKDGVWKIQYIIDTRRDEGCQ